MVLYSCQININFMKDNGKMIFIMDKESFIIQMSINCKFFLFNKFYIVTIIFFQQKTETSNNKLILEIYILIRIAGWNMKGNLIEDKKVD